MEYTQNYKFRLPADSDIINIGDIDENFINVDALIAALRSDKADKNSPSFTGTPKSTTPTSSDNSMRIATTAFVQALISSLQTAVNTSIANKADKNSPTFTGTPKSTTPTSSDNSTRIATTAFVQAIANDLKEKINAIKVFVGNAYLSDVIEFLTMEICRIQYGGHSEYEFYKIRCIGCQLKTGDYVSNESGQYTQYGSRNSGTGDFVIGFNPDLLVALPITAVTLDNCFYVGAANTSYKTVSVTDITNWTDEREEDDATYAEYDVAVIQINNN